MADRKRMKKDFDSLFSGDPKKREKLSAFSEKAAEVNKKRAAERKAKAAKRKAAMDKMTGKPKTTGVRGNLASQKNVKVPIGTGSAKTRNGKANVSAEQLKKSGMTLTQYMNSWNKTGSRPKAAKTATTSATPKRRKGIVGAVKTVLLGKDQKFGGDRGVIDFLPGKSRKKKPVKKAGGGMMKTKGMSKGGAMKTKGMSKGGAMKKKGMAMGGAMKKKGMAMGGAMKKKGMAMGGAMKKKGMSKGGAAKKFPDLTGDGKVTQADILKGRGVTKKKGGGMAKKGYAKGGMAKKGYAKGGPVRSKMSAKGGKRGGASRKPRGVGIAKRGFGKAMR